MCLNRSRSFQGESPEVTCRCASRLASSHCVAASRPQNWGLTSRRAPTLSELFRRSFLAKSKRNIKKNKDNTLKTRTFLASKSMRNASKSRPSWSSDLWGHRHSAAGAASWATCGTPGLLSGWLGSSKHQENSSKNTKEHLKSNEIQWNSMKSNEIPLKTHWNSQSGALKSHLQAPRQAVLHLVHV